MVAVATLEPFTAGPNFKPGRAGTFVVLSIVINIALVHGLSHLPDKNIEPVHQPVFRVNLAVGGMPQEVSATPSIAEAAPAMATSIPSPPVMEAVETIDTAPKSVTIDDRVPPEPLATLKKSRIPGPIETDAPPEPALSETPIMDKVAVPRKPLPPIAPIETAVPNFKPEPVDMAREISTEEVPDLTETAAKAPVQRDAMSNTLGAAHSHVIHAASYRRQTPPTYPRRAFELGQQGTVILHARVMPDGKPSELKVVESSGHRLLDNSAIAAVRTWEFEPVNVNGRVAMSWVEVPVRFVIR